MKTRARASTPSLFSTRLLTLATLSLASLAAASSSCDPSPGSALDVCLINASNKQAACEGSPKEKALCMCSALRDQARCWAKGDFCEAWRPNVVEADNMCALSRRKAVSSKRYRELAKEAAAVSSATRYNSQSSKTGRSLPVVFSESHRFRPHFAHQHKAKIQRPFGIQEVLEGPRDAEEAAFVIVQAGLFEFLDIDEEEEILLSTKLAQRLRV